MAGFYPDVPGHRFALDIDGTIFKQLDAGKTTLSDAASAATLINDTDDDTYRLAAVYYPGTGTQGYLVLVFPELRNIAGYFAVLEGGAAEGKALEYSSDTTDGLDGTWTEVVPKWTYYRDISPEHRINIEAQPLTNVKSLRFGYGFTGGSNTQVNDMRCLHIYGNIAGGQNPDRLRFWHDSLDQEVGPAHFDFGDNSLGSNKIIQFRVKNNSTSLTANNIDLAKESASFADVTAGLEFSADGTSFSNVLNIGNLAPGAISPVLHLRRSFAIAETASIPKEGRITAAAGTWS